jgi:hypothetical protein
MWERYSKRDKKRVLYRGELKSREGEGKERGKGGFGGEHVPGTRKNRVEQSRTE